MDNGVDYEFDHGGMFDDESPLQRIQRIQRIYGDFQRVVAVRIPKTYPPRVNPADNMTDAVFKSHFRFDKMTVLRLVDELGLHKENNRGLPMNPQQALCICLCHLAGGHFQRISALCIGNVSKSSAHYAIREVRRRILELKSTYVKMPTRQEREETAAWVLEKYHLPGFAYGIDGMLCKFEELPRGIPVAPGYPVAQSFFSRKACAGIPALTLGNEKHLILALDKDWQGSAHDAVIWEHSLFKPIVEENREHLVAGDSAFPISDVLIKPYTNEVIKFFHYLKPVLHRWSRPESPFLVGAGAAPKGPLRLRLQLQLQLLLQLQLCYCCGAGSFLRLRLCAPQLWRLRLRRWLRLPAPTPTQGWYKVLIKNISSKIVF